MERDEVYEDEINEHDEVEAAGRAAGRAAAACEGAVAGLESASDSARKPSLLSHLSLLPVAMGGQRFPVRIGPQYQVERLPRCRALGAAADEQAGAQAEVAVEAMAQADADLAGGYAADDDAPHAEPVLLNHKHIEEEAARATAKLLTASAYPSASCASAPSGMPSLVLERAAERASAYDDRSDEAADASASISPAAAAASSPSLDGATKSLFAKAAAAAIRKTPTPPPLPEGPPAVAPAPPKTATSLSAWAALVKRR